MSDLSDMQEKIALVVKETKNIIDLEKEINDIKIVLNQLIEKIKTRNF